MKEHPVVLLNYCAHAIEDLKALSADYRDSAPQSARVLERVIALLREGVKFILPNCAELIDPAQLGLGAGFLPHENTVVRERPQRSGLGPRPMTRSRARSRSGSPRRMLAKACRY